MSIESAGLSPADEQNLVRELAQTVVAQEEPDELAVFDETADEYFADPERALEAQERDEAVGFGIDLALLTPFVLAVATPVIQLLVTMVQDAVRSEAQPVITALVRRLLHRGPTEPDAGGADRVVALTADQVSRVRDVAFDRGRAVGLPEGRAALLADAIAGGIVVAP
jgi:hypothetical protein